MNYKIRNAIIAYIAKNGMADTRIIISRMASLFNTTKQRISGNISFMVKSGMVQIIRRRPHSEIY